MSERKPPSRYDNGEDNWHARKLSFEDWLRADKPSRIVNDKRTTEQLRRTLYADRSKFEPEYT